MNAGLNFLLFIPFLFFQLSVGSSPDLSDSLETAVRAANDPESKVNLLLMLSEETQWMNSEAAQDHALHALDLAQASSYAAGEIQSLNMLSEIYFNRTDLKMSMDYALKARMLARQVDNQIQFGLAQYNMGKVYSALGNFEKSSELFYESLKISEEYDDRVTRCKALNSIGVVYHNQDAYEKALEYYSKALDYAREIGYYPGIARGLNNKASIYGTLGDMDNVLDNLMEAIRLNSQYNNKKMIGVNFLNIGYYYQELGLYDSALFYYDKALVLYDELGNASSMVSANIFLTEFYLATQNFTSGEQTALKALRESRENGLMRFTYELAALLSNIYFTQGDSLKGYRYRVLELNMKDSLNIEASKTKLATLEIQYILEKKEQQKEAARQRKELILVLVATTLLFAVVVVVLLLGRMRIKARSVILEKEKLEMNLELRNKELTANVMSIMKKNETLSQIANKLKVIQGEAVKEETKAAIRKITQALNKAAEEEQWEEFELRFKQVHNDFYEKLIARFPNLSPQEQRLCAFLKLNMTSKEISEITGQRISTIEMARTRLRKKLGITNTQTNLIAFLAQI